MPLSVPPVPRPAGVPMDWRYVGEGQWASPMDQWGNCEVIHPEGTAPHPCGTRHLVIRPASDGTRSFKIAWDARTGAAIDWDDYSLQWHGRTEAEMEREFLAVTADPAHAHLFRTTKAKSFAAFMTSRRATLDDY